MKVEIIFPHRVKSPQIAEMVQRYLTLAGKSFNAVLTTAPFSGKSLPQLASRLSHLTSIHMSEHGREVDSLWFRDTIQAAANSGSSVAFVIGEAQGVPDELAAACGQSIRLTRLTLPHEMALLVLAEQLWRTASMMRSHPYHRQ